MPASTTFPEDDPFALLLEDHAKQWELCGWLERIADGLPDDVPPELCALAAQSLRTDMPRHHREEEEALFPLLIARAEDGDLADEIIAKLSEEHASDEGFAEELVDILERLEKGEPADNPNMLGYMLRGFFENYRRHIHWENTVLIPLAKRRLTAADVRELLERMQRLRAAAI